ncbi:MAG: hypothetical protein Kow00117_06590 [Phototrophicales bacterium]|nr:MAG: hypothetical protein CUN56_05585 [Phototrophicales bacterium]RMG70749.1 MAG: hypothetical protein D6711_16590 [Chloroflexota bacterium]
MTQLFGLIGLLSIAIMMFVLGMLSQRLGRVTRAAPYYYGFFLSAIFVLIGVGARLVYPVDSDDPAWVLLVNGTPALGITIGLVVAWHYWSWLLAERG